MDDLIACNCLKAQADNSSNSMITVAEYTSAMQLSFGFLLLDAIDYLVTLNLKRSV